MNGNEAGGLCVACLLKSGMSLEEDRQSSSDGSAENREPTIQVELPSAEKVGDWIGPYKLLEQIGEGGCGVVYVAEQDQPMRRRVALKVVKLGMDTRQVIARFEAERQALALMDHPNIAKVLDAGATESGRPFFSMELVKGVPITRYCDENKLDTKERLNLFIQVCQAIQHAHQKGIIHRDIKPSNVLVADHDGLAVPKIIDFGIAKATTDQRLTDKTLYTAIEQFIGTPAYMSPEQARLSGLDIDTRSDIYSLGVLLYELLTGRTPFDAKRLLEAGLDEVRRIIREDEPPRPSTRLSTLDAASQTRVAKQRKSDPPKLLGMIRGDLDWIVMKTLEKDRNRRYETANGLAMDVKRFLNNEPVVARPPSTLYNLQKIVRKHKLVFATGSAVALTIFAEATISTWLLYKEKEANRLRVAAETDRSVQQQKAEAESRSRQQLDDKVERAKAATRNVALAEQAYGRSEFAKAEDLFRESVGAYSELYGRNSLDAIETLERLAIAQHLQGKLKESETSLRDAVDRARKVEGDNPGDSLSVLALNLHHLAEILVQRNALEEARQLASEAVEIYQRHPSFPGGERNHAFNVMANVAEAFCHKNRLQEAEQVYRNLLGPVRESAATTGKHDHSLGLVLHHFANFLVTQNRADEAFPLADEAVSLYRGHADWPSDERRHAERVREAALANMANAVALEDGTIVPEPNAVGRLAPASSAQKIEK